MHRRARPPARLLQASGPVAARPFEGLSEPLHGARGGRGRVGVGVHRGARPAVPVDTNEVYSEARDGDGNHGVRNISQAQLASERERSGEAARRQEGGRVSVVA